MSNAIPFLLQGKNIILVIDGKSHTVSRDTHISYNKIVEALKSQDWDTIRELVEPKKAIINFGQGNISIEGDHVLWKGKHFHNALASRMIEMFLEGFPVDPMVRFMENLMQNPSMRSVDQLYSFLERNSLPITEDGHFLAYKKVRTDYLDIHSGTISNHIGAVVEMDRNMVDDNPNSTCSAGLHFCSESYLDHFGHSTDPVMILKINPADVVSIPTDYNGAKGRCCRYEVVAQVNGNPAEAFAEVVNREFSKAEILNSDPARPFAQGAEESDDSGSVGAELDAAQWYDVVRANGGWVEHYNVTLDEARNLVAKNLRQKKAKLKIVIANTDTEVK
jgi:hypothetical protein